MINRDKATGKFLKGTESSQKGKGKPLEGDTICPICKKQFHWKRSSYNKPPKTCSKECRYKSASISQKGEMIKRVCAICHKKFEIYPAWVRRNRGNEGTYCSKECRWKTRMKWTENEKQNAQRMVRTLIKQGVIIPERCRDCDKKEVEGHHYKGYERKNWLAVIWLCRKHHIHEHERLRRTQEITKL